MNKKLRWITETAVMLALLIALQQLTKPLGQLVTGSCVNTILAVAALVGGLYSGLTIAVISPVLAYLLGIAPQALTVPAIMVGNAVYVVLLYLLADRSGKKLWKQPIAGIVASFAKFGALHLIVCEIFCGVMAEQLLASGALKAPMLTKLPAMFSWPQLFTALIGSAIALLIVPLLRKALHKNAAKS